MLFYLFLLFTVVPIVELALLVWLGGQTVWWLPVLLVIADGVAGRCSGDGRGFAHWCESAKRWPPGGCRPMRWSTAC